MIDHTLASIYPVEITGNRVHLREFTADDLDASMAVVGDDRVTRWLSFDSKSRDQQRDLLAATLDRARSVPRVEYYLVIARPTDGVFAGFVRLALTGHRAAKLGYAVCYEFWGQGIATEAATHAIEFGFSKLGLHRITAAVGPDSIASQRVLAKLGLTYEGRLRHHVYTNGAWRDSLLCSILSDEWKPAEVKRGSSV